MFSDIRAVLRELARGPEAGEVRDAEAEAA